MFEIVRSKYESDLTTDFVAIGNLVSQDSLLSTHAAIIISHGGLLWEFDYDGVNINLQILEMDYFHKITNTIIPDEVPAFVAMCNKIKEKANPIYGFFYNGEYYNRETFHHTHSTDFVEVMTCVGFCLNVLKTFLEEEYLVYEEWNLNSEKWIKYLEDFCSKNNLDPSKVKQHLRRITPRECLTSCFFTDIPISKSNIESKIQDVNYHFKLHFDSINN